MKLQVLVELIRQEQKVHELIQAAQKDQQRYLLTGEAKALVYNAQQLNDLSDEASELETKRRKMVREIACEMKLANPEPTIKEILAALPEVNREELESSSAVLRTIVDRVHRLNHSNTILLQRAVSTIQDHIDELLQTKESDVYTRAGKKVRRSSRRVGLNVRI
jgi:hypothetical protein